MNWYTESQTREQTIPISKHISLRLYADTRPHNYYTADLQKGLILIYNGAELVGEGAGFGAPVVRYNDKTYFSHTSTLRISKGSCTLATKQFTLDTISEKQFRKVKMENKPMHKLTTYVNELYRQHRHWRLLTLANVSRSLGLQTRFVKVKPIGAVAVTYRIIPPLIHVRMSFDLLRKDGLESIFLLNEQSSRFFTEYRDSSGIVLSNKQIGAWEKVDADWATISNDTGETGFRLWRTEDTFLYRGREYLNETFDWAGLNYETSPKKNCFEYDIEILRSRQ